MDSLYLDEYCKDTDENKYTDKSVSLVDPVWETIDPIPDIYAMFQAYDNRFFQGKLCCVELKWSPRMYTCAGICSYQGRGGLCSIRLSEALLKFRPRKDLVETLLHEMIHAFLFLTTRDTDRDGHGPNFQFHMHRINKEAGTKITVYHSFHEEVRNYKVHWWRCDGPCQDRKPFFGWVKRTMNRAPGPNDNWWKFHQQTCNGKFIKVKEPENFKSRGKKKAPESDQDPKVVKKKKLHNEDPRQVDIRKFLSPTSSHSNSSCPLIDPKASEDIGELFSPKKSQAASYPISSFSGLPVVPFTGVGQKLGGKPKTEEIFVDKPKTQEPLTVHGRPVIPFSGSGQKLGGNSTCDLQFVECPSCVLRMPFAELNIHLDSCLS